MQKNSFDPHSTCEVLLPTICLCVCCVYECVCCVCRCVIERKRWRVCLSERDRQTEVECVCAKVITLFEYLMEIRFMPTCWWCIKACYIVPTLILCVQYLKQRRVHEYFDSNLHWNDPKTKFTRKWSLDWICCHFYKTTFKTYICTPNRQIRKDILNM